MKYRLIQSRLTLTLASALALPSCGEVTSQISPPVQNIIGVPPKEGNTCP